MKKLMLLGALSVMMMSSSGFAQSQNSEYEVKELSGGNTLLIPQAMAEKIDKIVESRLLFPKQKLQRINKELLSMLQNDSDSSFCATMGREYKGENVSEQSIKSDCLETFRGETQVLNSVPEGYRDASDLRDFISKTIGFIIALRM